MLVEAGPIAEEAESGARAPAVSVLIPVRNGAPYLEAALVSLAAQTFADFEIIVVDNGSSDRTAEILAAWQSKDSRIRILRQERPSVSASLNLAASRARAPLLARLDSDDIAAPGRLAAQVEVMANRPALCLLGSAAELIDEGGRRLGETRQALDEGELRACLRTGCGLIHSSTMMRRETFLAAGGYREGLNLAEDHDLFLRMAEHGEIANLPDKLVRYRVHGASVTTRWPLRWAIATACATAAAKARRLGMAEPFANGTPLLREALALLGETPAAFRARLRLLALRQIVSRYYLCLPFPAALKGGLRASAIALGLRPAYLMTLNLVVAFARRS